jgi:hypothetical protein
MSEIKKVEKLDQAETTEVRFVELEERVALAGATPRQLTGHEAGRVVGFGCDD